MTDEPAKKVLDLLTGDEAVQLSDVPAIIDGMKACANDARFQELACTALAKLAENSAPQRLAVCGQGGVEAVVTSMATHAKSVQVQFAGCFALRCFSRSVENQVYMRERAIGVDVCTSMKTHPSSAGLMEHACCVLGNLAYAPPDTSQEQCREYVPHVQHTGAMECVLACMHAHPDVPIVQAVGCGAIRNFSFSNQQFVHDHGAVQVVCATMTAHLKSATVQEQGVAALLNLSPSVKNHPSMLRHGVVERLCAAMGNHRSVYAIQETALKTLRNLCRSDTRVLLLEYGVLECCNVGNREQEIYVHADFVESLLHSRQI